jgi:hypothetical protein
MGNENLEIIKYSDKHREQVLDVWEKSVLACPNLQSSKSHLMKRSRSATHITLQKGLVCGGALHLSLNLIYILFTGTISVVAPPDKSFS